MNKNGKEKTRKKTRAIKILAKITEFLWVVTILLVLELFIGVFQKLGDKLAIQFFTSLHDYCTSAGKDLAIAFAIFSFVLLIYLFSQKKLRRSIRKSMTIEETFTTFKSETEKEFGTYNNEINTQIEKINNSVSEIKNVQTKLIEMIHLNAKTHAAHEKVLLIKVTRCNNCMNSIAAGTELEYRVQGLADEEQAMLSELEAIDN